MHHALEIQEILLNIFGHLDAYDTEEAESILVALARTCRTFKDPALDVLWKGLNNLSPLVRCIPKVSRMMFHKTRRRPNGVPFEIRLVVSVLYGGLRAALHRGILNLFATHLSTESLFPNLRHLCCDCTTGAIPLLPLPSLLSLNIQLKDKDAFQDYLQTFSKSSPNLTTLSIVTDETLAPSVEINPTSFCLWQNIQTLLCHRISLHFDHLVHLSRIPALVRLNFTLSATFLASDVCLYFSSLRELTLYSKYLILYPRLLSQIQLPAVTHFRSDIQSCPSVQDFSLLLASLQKSGVSLTIQSFRLVQMWPMIVDGDSDAPIPVLGLENLRPWMEFRNLRYIQIDMEWNVGLTNSDLLTLALAWPHLEHLLINEDWGWRTTSGITLNGLLQLPGTCLSLSHVALVIDTRGYTEPPTSPVNPGWTQSRVFSLDVVDSAIEEESVPAVATFLSGIARRCTFLFSAWKGWNMMGVLDWDMHRVRWVDVGRRVRGATSWRRRHSQG